MDKKDMLIEKIIEAKRKINDVENIYKLSFPIEIIRRMIEEEVGEKIWSE